MEMITKEQVKSIYRMGASLGMVERGRDDPLHQLVAGLTGKESVSRLSRDEAAKIINELRHRLRFTSGSAPARQLPGDVTEGQQRKILALMCELRKLDDTPNSASIEERVAGIIRKELHMTAPVSDPYVWLSYRDGGKLIEIIKGYLASAQRKATARGDTG